MPTISRQEHAALFGPTVGDKIRLGDTDLFVEIEKDLRHYGDESMYGGGKTLRGGMGGDARLNRDAGVLDLVITNVTVIDAVQGVIKADVGIRDGRIVGIGKSGNPSMMNGVDPDLIVGNSTDAITGEHLILTAGGIDSHVHYISPQQGYAALSNGVTTFFGGGVGPTDGTNGTTITPGPWNISKMLEAIDAMPVNMGILGKGHAYNSVPLVEQIEAGACGFKVHEDWGAMPSMIRAALSVADDMDVQVSVHTDTLNESGYVEDTIDAIAGRVIHTFHTEGAGGGHAPDILRVASHPNVLPSSTNPTLPFGINTQSELFDMIMVCHNLNPNVPSDVSFAESRVRAETVAAENAGYGPRGRKLAARDPDGRRHEGRPRQTPRRCARQRQLPRPALCGQADDQPRQHAGRQPPHRLRGSGQIRRPRALGTAVLRRQAQDGDQGRHDQLGQHG